MTRGTGTTFPLNSHMQKMQIQRTIPESCRIISDPRCQQFFVMTLKTEIISVFVIWRIYSSRVWACQNGSVTGPMGIVATTASFILKRSVDKFLAFYFLFDITQRTGTFFFLIAMTVKAKTAAISMKQSPVIGKMCRMAIGTTTSSIQRLMFPQRTFIFCLYLLMAVKTQRGGLTSQQSRNIAGMRHMTGAAIQLLNSGMNKSRSLKL